MTSAAAALAIKGPKLSWIVAGALFAIASVAIHYEVKIGMHHGAGTVDELGQVKVREPAPDFTLRDLAGQPVTLSSFRGKKAVLIDFWATWCAPCRTALPGLQDLTDKFKDRGFEVVTIDQGESVDQVRSFIERKKYSFSVLLDSDRAVGDIYGVRGIPTSVLIDKNGVVQWIAVGNFANESELPKRVEGLVKE
ncbi:MAG TPA: TlpA disulfide reductase family protein [Casimicrobiaceae bacterium]|jgi:peroxiredoxin|nr:TlpA disulfide reductase family protein [Casimicrobiaceae bacterium]